MNRLETIKEQYTMWENRYPLNPPETRAQEMAQEQVKRLAVGFEQHAPQYVGYLLQRLERYEKVICDIAFGRIEGDYSDVRYFAREALNDETHT